MATSRTKSVEQRRKGEEGGGNKRDEVGRTEGEKEKRAVAKSRTKLPKQRRKGEEGSGNKQERVGRAEEKRRREQWQKAGQSRQNRGEKEKRAVATSRTKSVEQR